MCRPSRISWLVSLALIVTIATPALGAKWTKGCPRERQKLYRVGHRGYTTSLFVHVGHDLTFRLRDRDILHFGGFSTEPDGNTVAITFTPIDGDPIPLPPFTVTAVSPDTLVFPAPDTRPILGRMVVGSAHIVVTRGEQVLIDARKYPIILPPMNDIQALTTTGADVEVLGAVDITGKRLWIPISFGGFGPGTPLAECPAEMTPIVSLAVDFSLERGPDQLVPHAAFTKLKQARLFLGDFAYDGKNLYGSKLGQSLNVRRLKGRAVALCALNDTFELVMMMRLRKNATGRDSDLIPLVRDGSPVALKLRNIAAEPEIAPLLEGLQRDSLSLPCQVAP